MFRILWPWRVFFLSNVIQGKTFYRVNFLPLLGLTRKNENYDTGLKYWIFKLLLKLDSRNSNASYFYLQDFYQFSNSTPIYDTGCFYFSPLEMLALKYCRHRLFKFGFSLDYQNLIFILIRCFSSYFMESFMEQLVNKSLPKKDIYDFPSRSLNISNFTYFLSNPMKHCHDSSSSTYIQLPTENWEELFI